MSAREPDRSPYTDDQQQQRDPGALPRGDVSSLSRDEQLRLNQQRRQEQQRAAELRQETAADVSEGEPVDFGPNDVETTIEDGEIRSELRPSAENRLVRARTAQQISEEEGVDIGPNEVEATRDGDQFQTQLTDTAQERISRQRAVESVEDEYGVDASRDDFEVSGDEVQPGDELESEIEGVLRRRAEREARQEAAREFESETGIDASPSDFDVDGDQVRPDEDLQSEYRSQQEAEARREAADQFESETGIDASPSDFDVQNGEVQPDDDLQQEFRSQQRAEARETAAEELSNELDADVSESDLVRSDGAYSLDESAQERIAREQFADEAGVDESDVVEVGHSLEVHAGYLDATAPSVEPDEGETQLALDPDVAEERIAAQEPGLSTEDIDVSYDSAGNQQVEVDLGEPVDLSPNDDPSGINQESASLEQIERAEATRDRDIQETLQYEAGQVRDAASASVQVGEDFAGGVESATGLDQLRSDLSGGIDATAEVGSTAMDVSEATVERVRDPVGTTQAAIDAGSGAFDAGVETVEGVGGAFADQTTARQRAALTTAGGFIAAPEPVSSGVGTAAAVGTGVLIGGAVAVEAARRAEIDVPERFGRQSELDAPAEEDVTAEIDVPASGEFSQAELGVPRDAVVAGDAEIAVPADGAGPGAQQSGELGIPAVEVSGQFAQTEFVEEQQERTGADVDAGEITSPVPAEEIAGTDPEGSVDVEEQMWEQSQDELTIIQDQLGETADAEREAQREVLDETPTDVEVYDRGGEAVWEDPETLGRVYEPVENVDTGDEAFERVEESQQPEVVEDDIGYEQVEEDTSAELVEDAQEFEVVDTGSQGAPSAQAEPAPAADDTRAEYDVDGEETQPELQQQSETLDAELDATLDATADAVGDMEGELDSAAEIQQQADRDLDSQLEKELDQLEAQEVSAAVEMERELQQLAIAEGLPNAAPPAMKAAFPGETAPVESAATAADNVFEAPQQTAPEFAQGYGSGQQGRSRRPRRMPELPEFGPNDVEVFEEDPAMWAEARYERDVPDPGITDFDNQAGDFEDDLDELDDIDDMEEFDVF